MNSSSKSMDGDKTRRKRLKVVSACGECRRKKTKCNGEKPCAGCLKAHVECKYVNSVKSTTTTVIHSPSTASITSTIIDTSKIIIKPSVTPPSAANVSSIESIEERLGAIENILRALLGSGKNKHLLQSLNPPLSDANMSSSSSSSSSSCGDMYFPHPLHAPFVQNRRLAREKRQRHEDDEESVTIRDSHGYQLAPIRNMNPGTPNIRSLLNDEEWYPYNNNNNNNNTNNNQSSPPTTSSAFYRMSPPRLSNEIIKNNSATTAAGTLS
jgi:hypothetical protein